MLKSSYLALMMLLGAGAANAATMKATYTGTILSGYDQIGVFGDADSDLTDELFKIIFNYDTSNGIRSTDATNDQLYGGSGYGVESPVTSVSVEIKGSTYSFSGSYQAFVYETASVNENRNDLIFHFALDDSSDGTSDKQVYAMLYSALAGLLTEANLDDQTEIDLTRESNYCSLNDYCIFGIRTYDNATGISQSTYAYLDPDYLSITEIYEVAPVPLPASALLLGSAFGAIGALRLRRRATEVKTLNGLFRT